MKGEVSSQTSNGGKGKNINLDLDKQSSCKSFETGRSQLTAINVNPYDDSERNRLTMEYVQNSEESGNKLYLKNDFEIGISEYFSEGQGFFADIHFDFQVLHVIIHAKFIRMLLIFRKILIINNTQILSFYRCMKLV
jgi:tRNA pseudouridine13 synthase